MGDKSVETLGSKIRFSGASWTHFPPSPQTMLICLFLRLHRPQHLHNIELGAGGIRELTLDANKTEQMLKYRKASFPKSVSTTFVVHCSLHLKEQNAGHQLKNPSHRCVFFKVLS